MRAHVSLPRKAIASLLSLCAALTPRVASALEQYAPTPVELALLPEYCKAKLDKQEYERSAKRWEKVLGPQFVHIHHYCTALNFINRARRRVGDGPEKRYDLGSAMGDLRYMFNVTNDEYILAPDFYIAKGEVSTLQGNIPEAEASYRKATQIRPNYPKGWIALSDHYEQAGRVKEAREAMAQGLNAAPEKYKAYMEKRLAELDSKLKVTTSPAGSDKPDKK